MNSRGLFMTILAVANPATRAGDVDKFSKFSLVYYYRFVMMCGAYEKDRLFLPRPRANASTAPGMRMLKFFWS